MELFPKKLVSLHLIDENFLFTDDLREKYSWEKRYQLHFYPSADRFFSDFYGKPLISKSNHIVILALNLAEPDKQAAADLIKKCLNLIPGADIINICHEKELGQGVYFRRNGNAIHIVNNENTVLRIDNAIKWVLAKTNLDTKQRIYKFTFCLFLISVIVSIAVYILFFPVL